MFGSSYTSIRWQIIRAILMFFVGWTVAGYLYH